MRKATTKGKKELFMIKNEGVAGMVISTRICFSSPYQGGIRETPSIIVFANSSVVEFMP